MGLTTNWYANNCACGPGANMSNASMAGTIIHKIVDDVIHLGFDGIKIGSCSQWNNMTLWAELLNATGKPILLENCHQGALVPGQQIPGNQRLSGGFCTGTSGVSDCPYHSYRSSDDIQVIRTPLPPSYHGV